MKYSKLKDIDLGLYKVFWKSGGCSFCAIGQGNDGTRWIAPTNWSSTSILDKQMAKSIDKVEVVLLSRWRYDVEPY